MSANNHNNGNGYKSNVSVLAAGELLELEEGPSYNNAHFHSTQEQDHTKTGEVENEHHQGTCQQGWF